MTDAVREREAFEASFPIPGSIKCRDGDTYSVRDGYEESYSAERYLGLWEGWKARAALSEQPAIDMDELRRAVCMIGTVGTIDGHDVIRRNSALEIIDARIDRANS